MFMFSHDEPDSENAGQPKGMMQLIGRIKDTHTRRQPETTNNVLAAASCSPKATQIDCDFESHSPDSSGPQPRPAHFEHVYDARVCVCTSSHCAVAHSSSRRSEREGCEGSNAQAFWPASTVSKRERKPSARALEAMDSWDFLYSKRNRPKIPPQPSNCVRSEHVHEAATGQGSRGRPRKRPAGDRCDSQKDCRHTQACPSDVVAHAAQDSPTSTEIRVADQPHITSLAAKRPRLGATSSAFRHRSWLQPILPLLRRAFIGWGKASAEARSDDDLPKRDESRSEWEAPAPEEGASSEEERAVEEQAQRSDDDAAAMACDEEECEVSAHLSCWEAGSSWTEVLGQPSNDDVLSEGAEEEQPSRVAPATEEEGASGEEGRGAEEKAQRSDDDAAAMACDEEECEVSVGDTEASSWSTDDTLEATRSWRGSPPADAREEELEEVLEKEEAAVAEDGRGSEAAEYLLLLRLTPRACHSMGKKWITHLYTVHGPGGVVDAPTEGDGREEGRVPLYSDAVGRLAKGRSFCLYDWPGELSKKDRGVFCRLRDAPDDAKIHVLVLDAEDVGEPWLYRLCAFGGGYARLEDKGNMLGGMWTGATGQPHPFLKQPQCLANVPPRRRELCVMAAPAVSEVPSDVLALAQRHLRASVDSWPASDLSNPFGRLLVRRRLPELSSVRLFTPGGRHVRGSAGEVRSNGEEDARTEALRRMCDGVRAMADSAGLRVLRLSDSACEAAWDSRPVAHGRYGSIVEVELDGKPALLKIFEGLKTDVRRRGKLQNWVRPLKEMYHLLRARQLPWACSIVGYVEVDGDEAEPQGQLPAVPLRVVGLVLERLREEEGWMTVEEACRGCKLGQAEWSSATVVCHVIDLLEGMCQLHSLGVAHMDIKPSNVMVNVSDSHKRKGRTLSAKYIDFGNSKTELFERDPETHELFAEVEFEGVGVPGPPLLTRAEDGAITTRVFHHRKDVPVNHFVDMRYRERSQECAHVDPMQLDQYALGVVIYEYVASAVEGTAVHGDGRGDADGGEFWLAACGGRDRTAGDAGWTGWSSCYQWQEVVRRCCSYDVAQRARPQELLAQVRERSGELARELDDNILWAAKKPKKGAGKQRSRALQCRELTCATALGSA